MNTKNREDYYAEVSDDAVEALYASFCPSDLTFDDDALCDYSYDAVYSGRASDVLEHSENADDYYFNFGEWPDVDTFSALQERVAAWAYAMDVRSAAADEDLHRSFAEDYLRNALVGPGYTLENKAERANDNGCVAACWTLRGIADANDGEQGDPDMDEDHEYHEDYTAGFKAMRAALKDEDFDDLIDVWRDYDLSSWF